MKKIRLFGSMLSALALIFATTATAEAFSLKNKLKDAAKRTVERNVNSAIGDAERAVDRGIDKLEDKAVDAIVGNKDDKNTNATTTTTNNNSTSAATSANSTVSKEDANYAFHMLSLAQQNILYPVLDFCKFHIYNIHNFYRYG